ncbi:MAG TPA: phosphatidylglycerol lysyltransferase domain-containing protein, partial [Patescibacteria group bacterium]|nr:phosphatidylglycerol lysyltransferase domain-containing protein [Patescibacteria group bacterium]
FTAVGYGSLATLPEMSAIFEHFGHFVYGAMLLRGLFVLTSVIAIVWLHYGLRARAADVMPGLEEIDKGLDEIRAWSHSTSPMLIACGDKSLFRSGTTPAPKGFIGYRASGRFLVAYSDPVCPAGTERDLLAAFLDHAAASDLDVILYQISTRFLPIAHDFGFTFFKLGEEAIVDLNRFDLKGDKAKSWRHAINSVEKAGGRFEIVEPAGIPALLEELKRVSDDWLAEKKVTEKRFSIGRFDEDYLRRFACAIIRGSDNRIVAFANVLEGRAGGEISIDLMRFSARREKAAALRNVMDCLLLHLMLHGRQRGFTRFNLGMAPLAAVGEERWARPFEKLAHLFFEHGEQWYNYQGLRRWKEKFDPSWEPRYLAYPRPWDWPLAVTSTAVLIAGGWRSLLSPAGARS